MTFKSSGEQLNYRKKRSISTADTALYYKNEKNVTLPCHSDMQLLNREIILPSLRIQKKLFQSPRRITTQFLRNETFGLRPHYTRLPILPITKYHAYTTALHLARLIGVSNGKKLMSLKRGHYK